MVKSELIEMLADRTEITNRQAEDVINIFFDSIEQHLVEEGRVELRGFGAFSVRKYKAFVGRNPKTGKIINVAEKKQPFWKTGLELKQRVVGLDK